MLIQDMRTSKKGSALILVVIVTVLLSVVGIMFVMTMRIREMTTSNLADDRDLDTAVGAVTGQIETVLLQDLFGTNLDRELIDGFGGSNEASDSSSADPWLAGLEPTLYDEQVVADPTDDWYQWDQLTNLYGTTLLKWDRILRDGLTGWTLPQFGGIVEDYQNYGQNFDGLPADADGDGVADSMWAEVPNLSTSRGKPVFAAVRIIDNCAMLNLNTTFGFYQQPASSDPRHWSEKPWGISSTIWTPYVPGANYGGDIGRYLSEVNFSLFLRAYDLNRPERIQFARDTQARIRSGLASADPYYYPYNMQADDYHKKAVMNIDIMNMPFSFFDISDELEIRNRYLLTGKGSSRFEKRDPREDLNYNASPSIQLPIPANAYQGIAYQTFDFGQGQFGTDTWSSYFGVRVASIPRTATNFGQWKEKINPLIFDDNPYVSPNTNGDMYLYDRRHLCTFYSFDRNIRSGYYLLLDSVLQSQSEVIEAVFRPLHRQPIDLRTMTEPNRPDPAMGTIVNNPSCIIQDTPDARRKILHLLYALREREYFALTKSSGPDPNALIKAARKAAQQVANIIDYQDDNTANQTGPFGADASILDPIYGSQVNADPTYIDKAIVDAMLREVSGGVITPAWASYGSIDFGLAAGEVVYGYERQPFISEVDSNNPGGNGVVDFAVELINPYDTSIDLVGWNVKVGTQDNTIAAAGTYVVPAATPGSLGRLTIYAGAVSPAGKAISRAGFGLNTSPILPPMTGIGNVLRLQRPAPDAPSDPNRLITVDTITEEQRQHLLLTDQDSVTKRQDTAWGFTNNQAYVNDTTSTLGSANGVSVTEKGYSLPVANTSTPFDRFADFQRVAYIGNQGGGTNSKAITDIIAQSSDESEIRFDAHLDWELLNYVCTLSRKEKGIPGRININTAPLHVIAAAIPPQLIMSASDPNTSLTLAQDIIDHRPYTNLAGLLNIQAVKKYVVKAGLNVGDTNIDDDLEERDWIFNRLSNIFTVRSDTFTAYILVRLGTDGPQRRMIAIFDRSNCWTITDKPQLVALHPVPDPR